MKSVFVRELEEFGIRLKEDGYPTAIVERAAERMEQLEDLVITNEHEFQMIGKDLKVMDSYLDMIKSLPMCRKQAS